MRLSHVIFKNFLFLSLAEIVAKFIGFFIVLFLARVLGPEVFGKINFGQALLIYFAVFANLGLDTFITREFAADREKIEGQLGNLFLLRIFLGIIGFIFAVFFVVFSHFPLETKSIIIIYCFSLFSLVLLMEGVFQGIEKMEFVAFARIVTQIIFLLLLFCFVKQPGDGFMVPIIFFVCSVLNMLFLFYFYQKYVARIIFKIDVGLWKNFIKKAFPIGFSFIMAQVFINIDYIMLGFMRNISELGYYSSAYKIVYFLILFLGTYATAIFPVITKFYNESNDRLIWLLSFSIKSSAAMVVPILIGGTILARPIIILLFGEMYLPGVASFQILLWAVLIIYINTIYSRSLLAFGKDKMFLWGVSVPAVLNIILNLFFIPKWGIEGAALATVLAELCGFMVIYSLFSSIIRIRFAHYFVKPLVAGSCMGIFLFLLSGWNMFLLIFLAGLIYLGVLFSIGGIAKEEFKAFSMLFAGAKFNDKLFN